MYYFLTSEAYITQAYKINLNRLCLEMGNTCRAISALEDIEIKSIQNRKEKDKSSQEEQVN